MLSEWSYAAIKIVRLSANFIETTQLKHLSTAFFLAQYSYKYLTFTVQERS